jgi:rubrerythrin
VSPSRPLPAPSSLVGKRASFALPADPAIVAKSSSSPIISSNILADPPKKASDLLAAEANRRSQSNLQRQSGIFETPKPIYEDKDIQSTISEIAESVARDLKEKITQNLTEALKAKSEEISQLTYTLSLWNEDINSFTTYISSLEAEIDQLRSLVNVERQRRDEDIQKMANLAASHLVPMERKLQRSEKRQTKLMQKVEQQREFLSCIVCFCKRRDVVLMPCNHLAICSDCATQILRQPNRSCPICRQHVDHIVKVYQV